MDAEDSQPKKSREMRIAHVTWTFTFGGIETMLVNIANEQVALGHEVHIVVIEHDNVEPTLAGKLNQQIKLHQVHRRYGVKDIPAIIRLNGILGYIDPDAIHLHSASIYKYLLPKKRRICNNTLHALCNRSNTDHIQSVPRVFAISQAVADDLKEKKGVVSKVIYNGIHPERIKIKNETSSGSLFRIVMVSRLEHLKKGQDLLIDALAELEGRGYDNITVDFIGDGESRAFLEQRCREKGVEKRVRFLGARSQDYIFEHLCDYDLFVQPSRLEGFALTVAEAMAARVPVLVASGQGPEEVADYGRCGRVFRNGDAVDCADKIAQIANGGVETAVIDAAFNRVYGLYDIKVTARLYVENYNHR